MKKVVIRWTDSSGTIRWYLGKSKIVPGSVWSDKRSEAIELTKSEANKLYKEGKFHKHISVS